MNTQPGKLQGEHWIGIAKICHKQLDKRQLGLYREEFRCTEMLCLCSKTYCCYDVPSNELKFKIKDLNKCVLEQSGDGRLEKYRKVLNET